MQQTDDEIQSTINVNLLGQIWVLREFLPAMVKLDRGSITFMCGLPGHAGAPNMVPYSASKFAIRGAMESLYVELRQNYPGNQLHLMLVSPYILYYISNIVRILPAKVQLLLTDFFDTGID